MGQSISLTDLDRPEEIFEVEALDCSARVLTVAVPNTAVRFNLIRRAVDGAYEGRLGGRSFRFTPTHAETGGGTPPNA
jgi:hypothetical protein